MSAVDESGQNLLIARLSRCDPNATSAERQDQFVSARWVMPHHGGTAAPNAKSSMDERPDRDIFLSCRRRYTAWRVGAPINRTSATRSQVEKGPCPYFRHPQ